MTKNIIPKKERGCVIDFIIRFIKAVIDAYIIHPIQRFFNFYFRGVYIPDNPRNQELLNYCMRVAENPETEPNSPTEIFFENAVKRDWEETFTDLEDTWEDNRQWIYITIADDMLQYKWIDEKEYFNDEY